MDTGHQDVLEVNACLYARRFSAARSQPACQATTSRPSSLHAVARHAGTLQSTSHRVSPVCNLLPSRRTGQEAILPGPLPSLVQPQSASSSLSASALRDRSLDIASSARIYSPLPRGVPLRSSEDSLVSSSLRNAGLHWTVFTDLSSLSAPSPHAKDPGARRTGSDAHIVSRSGSA